MRIGLMCAMWEEGKLFKQNFTKLNTDTLGGREYHSGQLFNKETTLVFSRWGKVAAAATAATLITKYQVDCILFTGVAGGIQPDMNIGDVIIGERLYQHDMDARPFYDQYQIPLLGETFFKIDKTLIQQTKLATQAFLTNDFATIPAEYLQTFRIVEPAIYTGTIATGDKFFSEPEQLAPLLRAVPNLMATEMEGAAVAQVCHEFEIPFAIMRIISDKADQSASSDFQQFVTQVAPYYSLGIIKELFSLWSG